MYAMLAAFPDIVVQFDDIFSILVVNEETPLFKAETQPIEFIMLILTLNHVPVVLVAIPNT